MILLILSNHEKYTEYIMLVQVSEFTYRIGNVGWSYVKYIEDVDYFVINWK